jgi:hypothetical protein
LELAALEAAKALTGQSSPPIELRRGKLAGGRYIARVRTPLVAALCGAVLFSICLSIVLFWRAVQYNHLATAARNEQLRAYSLAVPNTAPPPAITSRLRSEEKRLSAISHVDTSLPQQALQSVLPILKDTLTALPRNLRYRIIELRFEPQQLFLDGQTLDHAAADTIAASLRRGLTLRVDPPHTEQAPGEDVNFTISAAGSESAR